ncbi:hypothetical protein SISSUDRAFT_788840 [Sistotremastrum suecicum HHB10207 ss-3]|uniref:F-box domain-containing protein n=1 Tax=Sistotremastrum suecicum HHB10207 ss-3 TaxID=1314776 RepID=A0A166D244_9AGAM|nr:hypothetical protein SISSUDRAFT_788840 [Sistotremastrum suecicum HHB10207 ss-3]
MGQFNDLAVELVVMIMKEVGIREIVHLAQTSSRYRHLVLNTKMLRQARDSYTIDIPIGTTLQTIDQKILLRGALKTVAFRNLISLSEHLLPIRWDYFEFDEYIDDVRDTTPFAICNNILLFLATEGFKLVILTHQGEQQTISVSTPEVLSCDPQIIVVEKALVLAYLVQSEERTRLQKASFRDLKMNARTLARKPTLKQTLKRHSSSAIGARIKAQLI